MISNTDVFEVAYDRVFRGQPVDTKRAADCQLLWDAAWEASRAQARAEWEAELVPVGHAVFALGTVSRLIVREDVADEYAAKLRQGGFDGVKIEPVAIIPTTKEES